MSGGLTKVVVDCSASGPPDPQWADGFKEAAFSQLEKGNLEKAAALLQEARDLSAASSQPTETVVPLTDAEIKQHAKDQAAGLDMARDEKAAEIRAAIAATDRWVVRALEEGGQVSKPRAAHRQKLRDLLAATAKAKDHAALAKVVVPDPPRS